MRITMRTLLGATLLALLLAFTATAASAQYPPTPPSTPGTPTLTVTPPEVYAGDQLRVCGTGFPSDTAIAIVVLLEGAQIDTVTVTSDGAGSFCFDYTAPDPTARFTAPGDPVIVFQAQAFGVTVAGQAEILPRQGTSTTTTTTTTPAVTPISNPAQTSGDSLAVTGRSIGLVAGIGALLLVAGAAMWFVASRRDPEAA